MQDIEIFKNNEFGEIQIREENGKVEFEATSSAKILGYANPHDAIQRHCKKDGVVKHEVPHPQNKNKTIEKNFIDEGNLYRLITHSKLASAERFENWVFNEVLPSIRKNGAYMTPTKIEEVLLNPDTIIQLATDLKRERQEKEELQIKNQQQKQIIGELKPKADYTDKILQNKGLVTITAIAKDYGMTGEEMNKKLHELGVQYNQSQQWFLYSKYHGNGYTHSETIDLTHKDGTRFVKMNTKWTQKGRLFIYELLKKNGIIPIIEQKMIKRNNKGII